MSAGLKLDSWLWEVCFSQQQRTHSNRKNKNKNNGNGNGPICDQELAINVMKPSCNFNENTDVDISK